MNQNQQNESKLGGLQITQCQDLAVALQGNNGTFVANTPSGEAFIIEAAQGHSIASLCLLPKSQEQTTFNLVKVSNETPQTQWMQGQQNQRQQQ